MRYHFHCFLLAVTENPRSWISMKVRGRPAVRWHLISDRTRIASIVAVVALERWIYSNGRRETRYNRPLGPQRMQKILKGYTKLGDLLDPGRWPNPDIPTRQMLWILTVTCLQFMGDYWIRHVRPDLTEKFAQGIDKGISAIFQRCIGVNTECWSDIAKERLRLPIRLKGCGLREAEDRRFGQYLGATAQSVIHLIDRRDDNGNRIAGRLNTPAIVNLFGEGSFNHPFHSTMGNPTNKQQTGEQHCHGNTTGLEPFNFQIPRGCTTRASD